MWATRLVSQAERAGATARIARDVTSLEAAVEEAPAGLVVVDLGSHRFDGVAAVSASAAHRIPVIAVSQHEDHALRKRALDAGAARVYAYAKMHADGASLLREWLSVPAAT